MDRIFVTGATGFIGKHLVATLADYGYKINALLRDSSANEGLNHVNITTFTGDVLDINSICKAMAGCSMVFHLAALAKMWVKNKHDYYKVNVTGTYNILNAATHFKLKKIIIVSTAGILPPSKKIATNESSLKQPLLYTEYERTKNIAASLADSYYQKGLPVIIAYPTKVFGPGIINDGNSTTKMIKDYINGKWKISLKNDACIMNYVFIDDVVNALIKMMYKATPGSQYIIGGENVDYNTFLALVAELSGVNYKLYQIPYAILKTVALLEDLKARLFNAKPIITFEWVKKLSFNWSKDITLICTELNFKPISLRDGIQKTIEWLHATKQINAFSCTAKSL